MTKETISLLDTNNRKAYGIAALTVKALDNGLDDIDCINSLEVICDYLKKNDTVFDVNS